MIMSIFRNLNKIAQSTYGWLPSWKRQIIPKWIAHCFNMFHKMRYALLNYGKTVAKPRQNRLILDSDYTIQRSTRDCFQTEIYGRSNCLHRTPKRRLWSDPGLPRTTGNTPAPVRDGGEVLLAGSLSAVRAP